MDRQKQEKISSAIKQVIAGKDLDKKNLKEVFKIILEHGLGDANDVSFGALFAALQTKGPTDNELLGLIEIVLNYDREKIPYSGNSSNLCGVVGSGKDDIKTFNISTCAAFVASAAGVKMVKNGSRSESSIAGTTDVLEELGVKINLEPEEVIEALEKYGITFCDAGPYFPRMSREYVGKFLFPHPLSYTLSIASGLSFERVLFGVSFPETERVAHILRELGYHDFMVVSGEDEKGRRFDEISNIGPTKISEYKKNKLKTYTASPEDFGIKSSEHKYIKEGESVKENAKKMLDILKNQTVAPTRDVVLINAGALIYIADKAESIREGVKMAKEAIESGGAFEKFKNLRDYK